MKKLYMLIACVLVANLSKAQLVLTQAFNEPVVGDFEHRIKYDSAGVLPNTPGANQTWNFSTLTTTASLVNTTYTTPSSCTGYTAFTAFSGATVGQTDGSTSEFYKSSPGVFELIGLVPSSTLALSFSNTAVVANWPVSSTYSLSDAVAGTIKANIFTSITGPFNGSETVQSTGTGTLQLPNAVTLNGCMQLKTVLTGTGSVALFTLTATFTITNTSYSYYWGLYKFPALTVNYSTITFQQGSSAPQTTKTVATTINNDVFAGISELSLNSNYSMFPNPASNMLNLQITNDQAEPVSVEIVNSLGQPVKTLDLGNTKGEVTSTVDLNGFAKGIYLVKTAVGNKQSVKKLIVQ
ncbi:MAG: T9SS type A sorting domain-containing protein [Bacteroidia bacterium]